MRLRREYLQSARALAVLLCSLTVQSVSAEQAVTMEGELQVVVADDMKNHRSEKHYLIKDQRTKKEYRISNARAIERLKLKTGDKLRAKGLLQGKELVLEEGGVNKLSQVVETSQAQLAGEQRTIILAGAFNDAALNCSTTDINALMFGTGNQSVDELYQEMSESGTFFSGQVEAGFTLNASSQDSCNYSDWAQQLEQMAADRGVTVGDYDRKVYVLPRSNSCGWAGLGTVGGSPSRSWVLRCDNPSVYAHELGHNFGMGHASTETSEYGDYTDFMAAATGTLVQLNAPHREQLSWLPPQNVVIPTASGAYDIAPTEVDVDPGLAPQALKIPKTDASGYYYLSYRQPIGFDANLGGTYLSALHVHSWSGGSANTVRHALVSEGSSYAAPGGEFAVSLVSSAQAYATINLDLAGSPEPCVRAAPSINASAVPRSIYPGGTMSYVARVTNNSAINCQAEDVQVAVAVPDDWGVRYDAQSIRLLPGQEEIVWFYVTPLASAEPGVRDLPFTAVMGDLSGEFTYQISVETECRIQRASLDVTPLVQNAYANEAKHYPVTVSSNDWPMCGGRMVTLQSQSDQLQHVLDTTELFMLPGQQATVGLTLTADDSLPKGTYYKAIVTTGLGARAEAVLTLRQGTLDTEAPSVPTGLSASANRKRIVLSWQASSDNVGVSGYQIVRDGQLIGDVAGTQYTDSSSVRGQTHVYSVTAYDAAGNQSESAQLEASLQTKGGGSGGDSGGGSGGGPKPGKGKNK